MCTLLRGEEFNFERKAYDIPSTSLFYEALSDPNIVPISRGLVGQGQVASCSRLLVEQAGLHAAAKYNHNLVTGVGDRSEKLPLLQR